jgi:hypothetical protein
MIMLKDVFQQSVVLTTLIFMMMLLIEYINVLTRGSWTYRLHESYWKQYLFAAVLGATPGCLGAFAVVSLYAHGIVTLGALVTAMIATSGDEAFVMLAMIPVKYLLITGILVVLGLMAGWLTDFVFQRHRTRSLNKCPGFQLHENGTSVYSTPEDVFLQIRKCSATRGVLSVILAAITVLFILGVMGPAHWNWFRLTLIGISLFGLFIVVTVPDHFLEEHLWNHVVKHHLTNIFLWTFGALLLLGYLSEYANVESLVRGNHLIVLLIACLVGIIPESGPHLVFVTMYAQGMLPLSIILSSSIVQDGHGMLPLLAHSRKGFVLVKAINLMVGLTIGFLGYSAGL